MLGGALGSEPLSVPLLSDPRSPSSALPSGPRRNARAPSLGQSDGDGLLWRSGTMLAAADLVDLLTHEFARLGRRRLAGALVLTGLLDCSLLRHDHSPMRPVTWYDWSCPRRAAP